MGNKSTIVPFDGPLGTARNVYAVIDGAVVMQLTSGHTVTFDIEDFPALSVSRWNGGSGGYALRYQPNGTPGGTTRLMHRDLLPGAETVDHIDGNRTNNRRSNLRPATRAENSRNKAKLPGTKFPYKGVRQAKRGGKFSTVIHIGPFDTPEEAAALYDSLIVQYHGEFARTNAAMGLL